MIAKITQYIPPTGNTVERTVSLNYRYQTPYESMISHGYNLAFEILSTGHISITIENNSGDADIRIAENNKHWVEKIEEMLRAMLWTKPSDEEEASL